MPCDVGVCKYTPSPGDTSPKGCGLLPENEFVVWFYPKWKRVGETAFQFVDAEFTPAEAECFMEKLTLIEDYMPGIQDAQQRRKK